MALYELKKLADDNADQIIDLPVSTPGDRYIVHVEVGEWPHPSQVASAIKQSIATVSKFLGITPDRVLAIPMINGEPSVKIFRVDSDDPQTKYERLERASIRLMEVAHDMTK